MCCASCGIAEVDDVKLKPCEGCDLMRYCSDDCKEDHRPGHEAKCKERAAKLLDEILFKQPESSHFGDCPICFLPIPLDHDKYSFYSCCSKLICHGCLHADNERQWEETRQQPACPFCRHPLPETDEEGINIMSKRIDANDPVAMREFGKRVRENGDNESAFKYFTKAAELGEAGAHYDLSIMYMMGDGVEKDEQKAKYHLEEAAIGGHPHARHYLGCYDWNNDRIDRAVKHFIIAANLGFDTSLKELKDCYKDGFISKEDFAAALRAHHAVVEATKSPQREEAAKYFAAHQFLL